MGTAEDKETTEQDNKKLTEQEVSPFYSATIHHFHSAPLYFLVHLLSVHHTLTALIAPSSEDASVKLGHLLTRLSALYQLSSFSSGCPVCYPPPLPRQTSSAEPASVPEKAADSEDSKAGSEEKTGDERDGTESPSAKAEPSANPKEPTLKQTELPSSQTSPKSEWSLNLGLQILISPRGLYCIKLESLFVINSGALQRNREVLRKRRHRMSSGEN